MMCVCASNESFIFRGKFFFFLHFMDKTTSLTLQFLIRKRRFSRTIKRRKKNEKKPTCPVRQLYSNDFSLDDSESTIAIPRARSSWTEETSSINNTIEYRTRAKNETIRTVINGRRVKSVDRTNRGKNSTFPQRSPKLSPSSRRVSSELISPRYSSRTTTKTKRRSVRARRPKRTASRVLRRTPRTAWGCSPAIVACWVLEWRCPVARRCRRTPRRGSRSWAPS